HDADPSRGTVNDELVEAIDLVPTFLDALDVPCDEDRLEGRSLLPLIHGQVNSAIRDFIVNEFDYSFRTSTRTELNRSVKDCDTLTVRDKRWKAVFCSGLRPLLFDLEADPEELRDLGAQAQ